MATNYGDLNVTGTSNAAPTTIWQGGASVLSVTNTGAIDLYVNVAGVHNAGDWFAIAPGLEKAFNARSAGITAVKAFAASGTTARVMVNATNPQG